MNKPFAYVKHHEDLGLKRPLNKVLIYGAHPVPETSEERRQGRSGRIHLRSELPRPSLLGTRTLLGAPGLTTRSKDATRGSWHRF